MYVHKNFKLKNLLLFSGHHFIWLTAWVSLVAVTYHFTKVKWMAIPWLPVSIVATAVAFYVGFKNNQAYDRLWEARKIWGSIVNNSRAFATASKHFTSNQFSLENISEEEKHSIIQRLIYRHIAWLYVLREQLLQPTEWEHARQGAFAERHVNRIKKRFHFDEVHNFDKSALMNELMESNEIKHLINTKNRATQIMDFQSADLALLRQKNLIDDFRHMELQKFVTANYVDQGKCERIKKFPLPRQYGSMSMIFVGLLVILLPFGMVEPFAKLGNIGLILFVPFTVLVCWVYLVMELVGDYSENPFEGLGNDIPMLSLCRTIEIDLREMLGETDLPKPIKSYNGVLM